MVIWTIALRPARAIGRRAEGAALAALDAVLASDLAKHAVSRTLQGPFVEAVAQDVVRYAVLERVVDELLAGEALDSPAMDRLIARLLESKDLWLVVDEIAQSPAVTEAITRQSVSFADQVAGQVRNRSRTADARLERVARRVLKRPPNGTVEP